jgi:hypothetical protein
MKTFKEIQGILDLCGNVPLKRLNKKRRVLKRWKEY